jgi:hypothetical protein
VAIAPEGGRPRPLGGPVSIAVLEWQIKDAYVPEFKEMMGEMRTTIIGQLTAAGFKVTPQAQLAQIPGTGWANPQAAGRQLGVQVVLAIEVTRVGNEDTLKANLVDVETGRLLYQKWLGWQPTLTRTREIKGPYARQVAEDVVVVVAHDVAHQH